MSRGEQHVVTARWVTTADEHRSAAVLREVLAFAADRGMSADGRADVRSALNEALTNVARHAYPPGDPCPVRIDAAVDDRHLSLRIRDEGTGAIDEDAYAGRGVRLMKASCLRFELSGDAAGTVIYMEFALAAAVSLLDERRSRLGRPQLRD